MVFCPTPYAAPKNASTLLEDKPQGFPVAYLAGGCFWCVEYSLRQLEGVLYTQVGYMGGARQNPNYDQVSTGVSGHAEIVAVTYDPSLLDYQHLLRAFLTDAHDPTQLDRQGVDIGTQYRSEIFTNNEQEAAIAKQTIADLESEAYYKQPIVTKISPAQIFWEGETYHQRYYEKYEAKTGSEHIRVQVKNAEKARKRASP